MARRKRRLMVHCCDVESLVATLVPSTMTREVEVFQGQSLGRLEYPMPFVEEAVEHVAGNCSSHHHSAVCLEEALGETDWWSQRLVSFVE